MVLARMRRYSASLLVQESGFHQLVAEFNKGGGIPRASLAQEVAATVANAMASFSQVCRERESHAVDAVDYFEVAGGLGLFFQSERAPCSEGRAWLLISYGGLPFWPIVQPPFWYITSSSCSLMRPFSLGKTTHVNTSTSFSKHETFPGATHALAVIARRTEKRRHKTVLSPNTGLRFHHGKPIQSRLHQGQP